MEIVSYAQDSRDRFSTGALSDVSITSNFSAKVQQLSNSKPAGNVPGKRIKLMCSFGGKILPRPSDRRLRYVGGETKMVSISRHVHYKAFLLKLVDICGPDLAVKYQLPDEDLDALVSVTSDEDLENMMDECDRLDALEGASRLRVFVFSLKDTVSLDVNEMADSTMSELRYVDAINAVSVEASFKKSNDSNNSLGLGTYSWNDSQKIPLPHESLQPSSGLPSFHTSKEDDSISFDKALQPATLASKHTAPLEFISIQPAAKSSNSGHGTVADEFHDLESGGSGSSSTSSQQDPYSKVHWASKSYKQSQFEIAERVPQREFVAKAMAEDHFERIQQMYTRNVSVESAAQIVGTSLTDIRIPPADGYSDELIQLFNTTSSDRVEKTATNLLGDRSLSPGAQLHKQLEVIRDFSQPQEAERTLAIFKMEDLEPSDLSQGMEETGTISMPLNESLNRNRPIPDFLRTQAFEPLSNRQLLEASSDQAQPTMAAKHLDELQKSDFVLKETKRHVLAKDKTAGFSYIPYPSELYNEEDRERSDVSIFASQPFSKELFNTVFQTCSSEIPLPSLSEADELLQEVMAPNVIFADQTSLNDYHLEVTSQAPWPSPDPSAFPIYCQGVSSISEMSSDAFSPTHQIGMPRTQNYDTVQGTSAQLNGHYVHGGNLSAKAVNTTSGRPPDSEEKQYIVENGSMLPATVSTSSIQTESPAGSNLSSLGCLELPIDEPNETAFSYAMAGLTELSIDDARNTMISLRQVLQSANKPSLQQGSQNKLENKSIEAKEDMDSLKLGSRSSSSQAAPPLIEAWSRTEQLGHSTSSAVLLNFNQGNDVEETVSGNAVEKEMTIDEQKSDVEEFEIFQSAADRSMNLAGAAEVEAIARGLQIIRHCDLEELRELGSGTFGTVYHGKWRGTDVAIKRIKSSCFTGRPSERERLIADFWREACILGQLHHPNVVAFYGVVPDGPGGTLATVTEYMVNGSLKQALQKKERTLDRRKRLLIAMDVAFGMEYLHGKNVVHFDIKCENLLVNLRDLQRPICKVGDLGLSKVKQQTMVSGGVRGTLPWMAPELLNGSSSLVSEKVDVFSFGIVLWELLTGEEPYASMHYGAIIGGIVNNTLRPVVPRQCSPSYRNLMERCWSADPSERPTFSDIARILRGMEAVLSLKGQGQSLTSGVVGKEM